MFLVAERWTFNGRLQLDDPKFFETRTDIEDYFKDSFEEPADPDMFLIIEVCNQLKLEAIGEHDGLLHTPPKYIPHRLVDTKRDIPVE